MSRQNDLGQYHSCAHTVMERLTPRTISTPRVEQSARSQSVRSHSMQSQVYTPRTHHSKRIPQSSIVRLPNGDVVANPTTTMGTPRIRNTSVPAMLLSNNLSNTMTSGINTSSINTTSIPARTATNNSGSTVYTGSSAYPNNSFVPAIGSNNSLSPRFAQSSFSPRYITQTPRGPQMTTERPTNIPPVIHINLSEHVASHASQHSIQFPSVSSNFGQSITNQSMTNQDVSNQTINPETMRSMNSSKQPNSSQRRGTFPQSDQEMTMTMRVITFL